jgi:hypothetical protein
VQRKIYTRGLDEDESRWREKFVKIFSILPLMNKVKTTQEVASLVELSPANREDLMFYQRTIWGWFSAQPRVQLIRGSKTIKKLKVFESLGLTKFREVTIYVAMYQEFLKLEFAKGPWVYSNLEVNPNTISRIEFIINTYMKKEATHWRADPAIWHDTIRAIANRVLIDGIINELTMPGVAFKPTFLN